jgi:hypothetical protein
VVEEIPEFIRYIAEPSDDVQEIAVSASPWNIQYINYPCSKVQKLAVIGKPDTIFSFNSNADSAIFNDNKVKRSIMRDIMKLIQTSHKRRLIEYINVLEYYNVKWPELTIILDTLPSIPDDDDY